MNSLKLISLNLWGGYILDPLMHFLRAYREVDIFCFQELYHNAAHEISTDGKKLTLDLAERISQVLPHHKFLFRPIVNNSYGIGIFVKNTLKILDETEILIHENPHYVGRGPTHSRNMQILKLSHNGKLFNVANVHGLWNGLGKGDSTERLVQAQKIRAAVSNMDIPLILCGDFNLNPDTESMKIIKKDMRDLITENEIKSTRTPLYKKENKFADYMLTNKKITVAKFSVLEDVVSDHVPLLLEFSF